MAVVALGGCRADVTVSMSLDKDGAGEVSARVDLDKEAHAAAGDLRRGGRFEDLTTRGWVHTVFTPSSGGATVTVTKRVTSPAAAEAALAELAPDVVRDFRVTQSRSYLRTRTRVSGGLDLSAGASAFGDEALERLTGFRVGADPATVAQGGASIDGSLSLLMVVDFPGAVDGNANEPTAAGDAAWRVPRRTRVDVVATADSLNFRGPVAAAVSAVTGAAALLVLAGAAARAARNRRTA